MIAWGLENGGYEKFDAIVTGECGALFYVMHFALNALKKSKGNIVNICSKVAKQTRGNTSGYAAANGIRFEFSNTVGKSIEESMAFVQTLSLLLNVIHRR